MDIEEIKEKMTNIIGMNGCDYKTEEYAFFAGEKIWSFLQGKWKSLYGYGEINHIAYRGYRIYKVNGFYNDRIFFGKAYKV